MVCDYQTSAFAARELLPLDLDADVEDGQQLPAPSFQDVTLSGLIQVRVNDSQQHPEKKMQGDANTPEHACQSICWRIAILWHIWRALIHNEPPHPGVALRSPCAVAGVVVR